MNHFSLSLSTSPSPSLFRHSSSFGVRAPAPPHGCPRTVPPTQTALAPLVLAETSPSLSLRQLDTRPSLPRRRTPSPCPAAAQLPRRRSRCPYPLTMPTPISHLLLLALEPELELPCAQKRRPCHGRRALSSPWRRLSAQALTKSSSPRPSSHPTAAPWPFPRCPGLLRTAAGLYERRREQLAVELSLPALLYPGQAPK